MMCSFFRSACWSVHGCCADFSSTVSGTSSFPSLIARFGGAVTRAVSLVFRSVESRFRSACSGVRSFNLDSAVKSIRCREECGRQFSAGPESSEANNRSSIFERILLVDSAMDSGTDDNGALAHHKRCTPTIDSADSNAVTNNNTEKLSAAPAAWTMAGFLFLSGLGALVYQIGWMREFRLIFGASTAASAAVVAIFIGGLGVGGIIIGKRVDRHPRPLMLYGWLEICIAGGAALSPFLLWLIRWIYLSAGGTTTMGIIGGTIVRLVLATLVLGVPTFLMGGTLPAAVRAIASEDDRGRRRVALLYGINTLGAVLGSALATFYMIEQYGTPATLWFAALINLALGALVISRAKKINSPLMNADERRSEESAVAEKPEAPAWFVLPAAAIVGFAFFLMEMIWYRMLSPLLGGSVFTFGLILCLGLLGIGIAGLLYAMQSAGRPARLWVFAMTCLLEAAFVMVSYAMGDRLAWVATSLQAWSVFGFAGLAAGWAIVAGIAVLAAGVGAGVQISPLIPPLRPRKKRNGRPFRACKCLETDGRNAGGSARRRV